MILPDNCITSFDNRDNEWHCWIHSRTLIKISDAPKWTTAGGKGKGDTPEIALKNAMFAFTKEQEKLNALTYTPVKRPTIGLSLFKGL